MAGGLLVLFLGMYSWNQRTHTLDDIAANVGLEMSGTVLGTFDSVKGSVMDAWQRYVDLVGVREENERLRAQVAELQARIVSHGEDLAELARLRELVQLEASVGIGNYCQYFRDIQASYQSAITAISISNRIYKRPRIIFSDELFNCRCFVDNRFNCFLFNYSFFNGKRRFNGIFLFLFFIFHLNIRSILFDNVVSDIA